MSAFQPFFGPSRYISMFDVTREPFGGSFPSLKHTLSIESEQDKLDYLIRNLSVNLTQRSVLLQSYEMLRASDIVQTIIDCFIDDAFSQATDIFKVQYNDTTSAGKKIQTEIDAFLLRNDVPKLIFDCLEDLLLFGDKVFHVEARSGGKGLRIAGDVDITQILPVYNLSKPILFASLGESFEDMNFYEPSKFFHLSLYPRKIPVYLPDSITKLLHSEISGKYFGEMAQDTTVPIGLYTSGQVRIGRSIIYPAIQRIKELEFVETARLARNIYDAMKPEFLTVTVPQNTPPDDVVGIIEKYREYVSLPLNSAMFESFSTMSPQNLLSVLLTTSAQPRVLPNFTDQKGDVRSADISRVEERRYLEETRDKRRSIARAVGIPPTYVDTEERGEKKNESLKVFSRYTRKLWGLQDSVALPLKSLIYNHLKAKSITINMNKLEVGFKSIINIDELENAEFLSSLIQTTSDLQRLIDDISRNENLDIKVDSSQFVKFLNSVFENYPELSDNFFQIGKKKDGGAAAPATDNMWASATPIAVSGVRSLLEI